MEQNLVQANGPTLAKSTIASYVHDMKELEQQQFTLRETHAKCVAKRQFTDETAKQKMREAENTYQQANVNLNEALKNRIPEPKEIAEPKKIREPNLAVTIYLSCIFCFPMMLPIAALLLNFLYELTMLILALPIIFGVCIAVFIHKRANRRYDKYLNKYKQYIDLKEKYNQQGHDIKNLQNQLRLGKKMLEEAKQYQHDAQMQIENLDRMAEFLSLHIAEIEERKNRLYTVGIVPPDYRKLDCLIEFDQMFRNDLVDTVREAVKIYEERVFRGELVRGIDNIYNMLGNLSASMHNIENTLYGIQSEVRLMSDEIYNISAATESFQSNMLSESRAARYATEALQKSQEKCESYLRSQYYNI